MNRTKSEHLFEEFCKQSSIHCERIPETDHRTPDYCVNVSSVDVICEVKEVELSKEEIEAEAALKRGEFKSISSTVGAKVRQQIDSGYPQIKAYAKGSCPGVLVLWKPHLIPRHLDTHHVRAAMYGFDTIVLSVPNNTPVPPKVLDRKSGPKKRVTKTQNRSLSAIAVLRKTSDGDAVECRIYHNQHAATPLPPEAFKCDHVQQYRLREKSPGQFDEWEQIK